MTHNTPGEEFRLAREWKELRDRQEREKKDMEERHRYGNATIQAFKSSFHAEESP